MSGIMLTASQARAKSRNDAVIFNEIRDIEDAILTACSTGDLEVYVVGTTMTDTTATGTPAPIATARDYFKAWAGTFPNRAKEQQMAEVITYFTNLGYQIERRVNNATGDTFKWGIFW